jgi:hypothetical protein
VSVNGTEKRCRLCELPSSAPAPVDICGVVMTTVYADDELVGLVGPETTGAMVVPRSHVGGLGDMPGLTGVFLGALRRAVLAVQAVYGTSGAMIEPIGSMAGAAGHVAYRVVPTAPADGERSLPPPVSAKSTVSEYLAEVLGSRLAPR